MIKTNRKLNSKTGGFICKYCTTSWWTNGLDTCCPIQSRRPTQHSVQPSRRSDQVAHLYTAWTLNSELKSLSSHCSHMRIEQEIMTTMSLNKNALHSSNTSVHFYLNHCCRVIEHRDYNTSGVQTLLERLYIYIHILNELINQCIDIINIIIILVMILWGSTKFFQLW